MTYFEVPGKPQGKARARVTVRGSRAFAYTPENTVNYENYIRLCYQQSKHRKHYVNESLKMTVVAHYPIPQSWSKRKQEQARTGQIRPLVKPDLDNVAKVVADALNNIAYADDKQICELIVAKKYGDKAALYITINEVNNGRC